MIYDLRRLTGKLEPFDRKGAKYPNMERALDTNSIGPELVPPLCCTLFRKEGLARTVTVTEGKLIEVLPRYAEDGDDSIVEHPIDEIFAEDGLLKEHSIEPEQCIGVSFFVDEKGYVDTDTVTLDVRDFDSIKSGHYQPPVGEGAGASGNCFYVLARLRANAITDYLEVYHSGSNIDYVHDLPPFKKATDSVGKDIFVEYDMKESAYRYKGVRGESPISVDADGVDLIVKLATEYKLNLDLIIKPFTLSYEYVEVTVTGKTVASGEYDGKHSHTGSASIPSLSLSGTTALDGNHNHVLENHFHGYLQWNGSSNVEEETTDGSLVDDTTQPFALTGARNTDTNTFIPDGAHQHSVTLSSSDSITATVTIPTGGAHVHDFSGTASVPKAVFTVGEPATWVYLSWRKGLFAGKASGATPQIPGIDPEDPEPIQQVIHVYQPAYTP